MQITFVPQRRDDTLTLERSGDVLSINHTEVFDFTFLQNGDVIAEVDLDSEWIVSDVTRVAGEVQLRVLLPHGPDANDEMRFPHVMSLPEGATTLPAALAETP